MRKQIVCCAKKLIFFFPEPVTSLLYEIAVRANRETFVISFFHKAKTNHFLADRPLEPVGWLTDKIAIKGKNRDICNIIFLKQNAKNNPSDSSFVLIFELIYILIV